MSHKRDGEIALDLDGQSYSAPNGAVLLDAVTLHLLPGEILAVVGLNGAGKSTLIQLLAGLMAPSAGTIELHGRSYATLSSAERARRIAYVGQHDDAGGRLLLHHYVALGTLSHRALLSAAEVDDGSKTRCTRWTRLRMLRHGSISCRAASVSEPSSPAPSARRRACCCWTSRRTISTPPSRARCCPRPCGCRALLAVIVGAGLGMVGAVLQTLTRDDLADPFLFGLSSGAAVVITVTGNVLGIWTLPAAAFAGGLIASLIVLGLFGRLARQGASQMVLAGLAVSFLFVSPARAGLD